MTDTTGGQSEYIAKARSDGQVLLEEARWLHAYHLRASESSQQRAMAIIGFGGVLVALVPSAIPAALTLGQWWLLAISLALVIVGVTLSAVVLLPRSVKVLGIMELRSRLHELTANYEETTLGRQVFQATHALIFTPDPDPHGANLTRFRDESIIATEERVALQRMKVLGWSVWLMVFGVASLASLLVWAAAISMTP